MIARSIRSTITQISGRQTTPLHTPGAAQTTHRKSKKIRYAVVGLGHIAQIAVLPAFKHATRNSELSALVSGDPTKLRKLCKRYQVPWNVSYEEYEELLLSGNIDAVYIAEPNSLHADFVIRAANAGIHVLCEKPLGASVRACEEMIAACRDNRVKLMTAYRLHFEKSNLEAIRLIQSGKIGEPRYFNSTFSMQAAEDNVRLRRNMGGGPLFDLGVYCINAARYLFRAEPEQVTAFTASGNDKRFREVEEMAAAVLKFPSERLANFVCSFGATDSAEYQIVGTKGSIHLKNGYEYASSVEMNVTVGGKTKTRMFEMRDQFAPELLYFSDCIRNNREPEPSGLEGLADVRVIQAIFESAQSGTAIKLPAFNKRKRPAMRQEIKRSPVKEPKLVKAKSGSKD